MGVQVIEIHRNGSMFWDISTVLSVNTDLDKTYTEIRTRFNEIATELGEHEPYSMIRVMSVVDYYKHELFIDSEDSRISKEDRKFLDSLFPKFCETYGIFQTGFIIELSIKPQKYTRTIKQLKDELLHLNPKS